MWLLHVKSLEFVNVQSHGPFPRYAVLSHVWLKPTDEEVTFQDVRALHDYHGKLGWAKIFKTIKQAKRDGLEFVWIDTCCIDKLNPTELTEAINCMYNWYQKAEICYVYLEDVGGAKTRSKRRKRRRRSDGFDPSEPDWEICEWFSRGWTLQELIAPPRLEFFDSDWEKLCSRDQAAVWIARRTGVDTRLLATVNGTRAKPGEFSVAQRFSWAAGRKTSRPEDRVYSLFGLFDIVLPTHYGEGEANAFKRLQEEIIKATADQSLFVWRSSRPYDTSLLAPSPDCFKGSHNIVPRRNGNAREYRLSNLGLHLNEPLLVLNENSDWESKHKAILNCRDLSDFSLVILLNLTKCEGGYAVDGRGDSRYETVDLLELKVREEKKDILPKNFVVKRSATEGFGDDCQAKVRFADQTSRNCMTIDSVFPREHWSMDKTRLQRNIRKCGPSLFTVAGFRVQYRESQGDKLPKHIVVGLRLPYFSPLTPTMIRPSVRLTRCRNDDISELADMSESRWHAYMPELMPVKFYDSMVSGVWRDEFVTVEVRVSEEDVLGDRLWNVYISCTEALPRRQAVYHAAGRTVLAIKTKLKNVHASVRTWTVVLLVARSYGRQTLALVALACQIDSHVRAIQAVLSAVRSNPDFERQFVLWYFVLCLFLVPSDWFDKPFLLDIFPSGPYFRICCYVIMAEVVVTLPEIFAAFAALKRLHIGGKESKIS